MPKRYTRVNECGCTETWNPVPGCDPERQNWVYGLWLGCDEHLANHVSFLESIRTFPNEAE